MDLWLRLLSLMLLGLLSYNAYAEEAIYGVTSTPIEGAFGFILGDDFDGSVVIAAGDEKNELRLLDENFGKGNTLYTYAFVIQSEYKGNGYAKMLKRVFLSWAKKRKQTEHITGHVANGISARFTGDIKIVNRIDNWQGTGKSFEYYRRDLIAEKSSVIISSFGKSAMYVTNPCTLSFKAE